MVYSVSLITSSGNTISIKADGEGPVMMFLHGFPLDHRMWLPLLGKLKSHFHCIAMEFRGFGGSTFDQQYSISELGQDVEYVRSHFAPDQTVHLVGLSMGGYVAFEYWKQFARNLRSLILVNTRPGSDEPSSKANRHEMARKAQEAGAWPAVAPMLSKLIAPASVGTQIEAAVKEMMQSASAAAIAAAQIAMAERRDFTQSIGKIGVPTLVVTGEHDSIAPPTATKSWAQQIPRASYIEIPEAGHLTPLEKTDEFASALLGFVAGL